jgi:hypothetical protein
LKARQRVRRQRRCAAAGRYGCCAQGHMTQHLAPPAALTCWSLSG